VHLTGKKPSPRFTKIVSVPRGKSPLSVPRQRCQLHHIEKRGGNWVAPSSPEHFSFRHSLFSQSCQIQSAKDDAQVIVHWEGLRESCDRSRAVFHGHEKNAFPVIRRRQEGVDVCLVISLFSTRNHLSLRRSTRWGQAGLSPQMRRKLHSLHYVAIFSSMYDHRPGK
jgi:hypothetical protein